MDTVGHSCGQHWRAMAKTEVVLKVVDVTLEQVTFQ